MHHDRLIRSRKATLVLLGILTAVAVAGGILLWRHYDVRGYIDRVISALRNAGPLPFFSAMALLPAVGFPLSAFTFVAGPVFGPTLGVGTVVLCAVAAIAANVALSYGLAAYALRPVAAGVVRWLGYQLPDIKPTTAWLAIVVLRVVPVTPFFLQSLILGLARVPFGTYLVVSVLVPSTYAASIIVLGDGLMRGDRWAMAGSGAMFVGVGIVLHIMRKRLNASAAAVNVKPPSR